MANPYLPPFARMRQIKKDHPTRRALRPIEPKATPEPEPTNVAEAIAAREAVRAEAPAPEPVPESFIEAAVQPLDVGFEPAPEENVADLEEPTAEMSRRDLNRMAMDEGIDRPDKFPNKKAVIDAILAAREQG